MEKNKLRVLWFTPTSSLYNIEAPHFYYGGGWIESLERLLSGKTDIELGISFYDDVDNAKKVRGNVTYFPILMKKGNWIKRLINNWTCSIEPENDINKFLEVIDDFKPDVIHIFGTERPFAKVQSFTKIPVVIHLQGLIIPYNIAYYPPGISNIQFLFSTIMMKNNILGNSPFFSKIRFEKQARREYIHFKNSKYIQGRTGWDKIVTSILAPQSTYFHVDEVLRQPFYEAKDWKSVEKSKTIIVSTISSTIYKGLDLILKTAQILKQNSDLTFEWKIVGIDKNDKLLLFFQRVFHINHNDCNIVISGKKSSEELINILDEATIFVHPSYIDNSPNSVCEAQMLGMPVIACNVGGLPSLVEDNINGMLVPANAPFELAHAIKSLSIDSSLRSKLGKEARLTAMKRHDREKITGDIIKIYNTLANPEN